MLEGDQSTPDKTSSRLPERTESKFETIMCDYCVRDKMNRNLKRSITMKNSVIEDLESSTPRSTPLMMREDDQNENSSSRD